MLTRKPSVMLPRDSGRVLASDGSPGDTLMNSSLLRNGNMLYILAFWVVQSNVQNSIATAFIGLFYGPVFPGALGMANDVLPEEVHMVSMALINAFASLGGAIFPVVTGTVLSLKGVSAFTFVTVPLAASLALLWGLFPARLTARSSPV
ncbi:hypothetical protein NP233_g10486 [Leucocoprinus birnbaumii]|uniref:Major facilitator superfamily (MFS) profile domain-containing protein n=1 Tax=Leucocoprinus birnbaumii TaxID=56174 RepID=A0AAD5VI70_9AGAR|nr:hypothetical protein NP233_g10486 [Leucocoprinus birnbaumii]